MHVYGLSVNWSVHFTFWICKFAFNMLGKKKVQVKNNLSESQKFSLHESLV